MPIIIPPGAPTFFEYLERCQDPMLTFVDYLIYIGLINQTEYDDGKVHVILRHLPKYPGNPATLFQDLEKKIFQKELRARQGLEAINITNKFVNAKTRLFERELQKVARHRALLFEFVNDEKTHEEYVRYLFSTTFYLMPDCENDTKIVDEFLTSDVLALASTMPERNDLIDTKWLALMKLSPNVKFYYAMAYYDGAINELVYSTFPKIYLPYSHVCLDGGFDYIDTNKYVIFATCVDVPPGAFDGNIKQIKTKKQLVKIIKNIENCTYREQLGCMKHCLFFENKV